MRLSGAPDDTSHFPRRSLEGMVLLNVVRKRQNPGLPAGALQQADDFVVPVAARVVGCGQALAVR